MAHATSKNINSAFVCIFLVGALVRVIGVWRPVDKADWRECDMAGVARNYYREGMNLFYPRIDWRGDGPGYAEMEFPIYPWSIAVLYKAFGIHESFGRILSFIFSLIALAVFFRLARYLLPGVGAVAAAAFFALSPLVIRISKSLQPDGLMFLCYLLAAYAFIRWIESDSWKYYFIALVSTAIAILAKAPAVHIGLFFAGLLLWKRGFSALRQPRVWFFGVASLLPGVLWYVHARDFWITYGNSLGVSNEYHWAGWDLFTNPSFLLGIGRSELTYVWMPAGALLILLGLLYRRSERAVMYGSGWFCAILLYYFVAARTTGDGWAVYYHVVSVPPIALLFGVGVLAIERLTGWPKLITGLTTVSVIIAVCLAVALGLSDAGQRIVLRHRTVVVVAAVELAVGSVVLLTLKYYGRKMLDWRDWPNSPRVYLGLLGLACLPLVAFSEAIVIRNDISPGPGDRRGCAAAFAPLIFANTLMLASGGVRKDPTGYPVAYNAPEMFYWLDRKGFNISVEDQSLGAVRSFAQRGARYFVADKARLKEKPGFEAELLREFPLIRQCGGELLFELKPSLANSK
jgi:4-amino-4-deoxy-L-arabinose transferase-like glycosyltransferase